MLTVAVSDVNMSTLITMLVAQKKHVQNNVKDKKFGKAFTNNISNFIAEANACTEYVDYKMLFSLMKEKQLSIEKSKWFKSSEREGIEFSLELIEDAINSIDTRFINGGHKLYESLLNLKGLK